MRVLVGCERSGIVRSAFRARGHDAWSCDLAPAEDDSEHHFQGDILSLTDWDFWDLFIVFPEYRYLAGSGLHWNGRVPGRAALTQAALDFVRRLFALNVRRMCLENSVGLIGTAIRPPDQTIQPYQFGADASKRTCFWLRNLPPLRPTTRCPGRWVEYPRGSGRLVERWANQTDGGQNRLGPSDTRSIDRARTYPPVADAMAEQWGGLTFMGG
jgi:hypothetical protein